MVARQIDMVAWFDKDGVHPARFKIEGKEGNVVVKIDKIIKKDSEKLAGNFKPVRHYGIINVKYRGISIR